MEPSTTKSGENQHKNGDDLHQLQNDCRPLIMVSCKATNQDQEINGSSNQSTCAVSEAFSIENAGEKQEKRLEKEPTGREKLMSHWKEGSRMVIPERWGKEDLLKDWVDYSTFDALLAPKEAGLAREALVAEARRRRHVSNIGL